MSAPATSPGNGRAVLAVQGKPIDATYLVFWVDIETGSAGRRDAGVIRKGASE